MPVGKTKDVGWEIGVSRTVAATPEEVWGLLTSRDGVAAWLGEGAELPAEPKTAYETTAGTTGELRSVRPLDRIRLTWHPESWDHESTVQVVIRPAKSGTSIRFHQERLADAEERERQRAHWAEVIDRLEALLSR